MELQLKHLAPYLPYGLPIYQENSWPLVKIIMNSNGGTGFIGIVEILNPLYKYMPILRPMSDIDKPITIAGAPYTKCSSRFDLEKNSDGDWCDSFWADQCESPSVQVPIIDFNWWLFEYHFDVFGLIPAGLAININALDHATNP